MDDLKSFLVKGAPIVADIEYVRKQHGEAGLSKVIAAMPPEIGQQYLSDNILNGSWYSMEFRIAILKALDRVFAGSGSSSERYFFELGAHQAEHNIRNLYKSFMKIVGPSRIIRMAKLFWGLIYKSSRVEVTTGNNSATFEVFDYPKTGVYNCNTIRGYLHRAAEISSSDRRNVRSKETSCIHRGDKTCIFVLEWDAK